MKDIAIIGCGNMGSSLAEWLSRTHRLLLHDRDWTWTQELAQKVQGKACQTNQEAIDQAQLIILSIKPNNLKEISHEIGSKLREDQLVVSLLAGTPCAVLRQYLPKPILVRMMPNLALRYGEGVIGLVACCELIKELKQELSELFAPLGLVYWLKESLVDALTSLTGSGPAFMLTLIETMIEAGITMGFQAKDSQKLVIQMLRGSLALLEETAQHPAELKWQIASPAGTTMAGFRAFEQGKIRSALIETFLAAYQRTHELAAQHHQDLIE